MADVKIDEATLDDVGSAIIEKGGATEPMYPAAMAANIRAIPTVGVGGDMKKSVYDTNDDGVVDKAKAASETTFYVGEVKFRDMGNGLVGLMDKEGWVATWGKLPSDIRPALCPNANDGADSGAPNRKFSNVYAVNGVIQTSDRNEKADITALDPEQSKAFIMGLKPVSYKMKNGTSGRTHDGFIAQDIEELMASLGMTDKDFAGFIKSPKEDGGFAYALRYAEFLAKMVAVIQYQQKEIDALKKEVGKNV